jgi:hypothetical protein
MTTKTPKKKFLSHIKDCADIITAVGVIGAALVAVGTWCTTQINASTNAKLDAISSQVTELKLDATRSQLLTLMKNYPDNEEEIMKVAKYYFKDLDGDWYMTSLFIEWGEEKGIDISEVVNVKGK